MLNIVTGKINSGKTTKLLSQYNQHKIGDGFVSIKNMDGNNVHSYDILRLSTNQKKQFIVHDNYLRTDKEIICKIGPYNFLKDTYNSIEETIRSMIRNDISPIYLDEIGSLELYDQCFHQIFKELIESNTDVYVVIREELIDQIIKKYKIKDYRVVR